MILKDTWVIMFANPLSGSRKAKKWLKVTERKEFQLPNGTSAIFQVFNLVEKGDRERGFRIIVEIQQKMQKEMELMGFTQTTVIVLVAGGDGSLCNLLLQAKAN